MTERNQSHIVVGDGRFVVAWVADDGNTATGKEVRVQIFAADGTPQGSAWSASMAAGDRGTSRLPPLASRSLMTRRSQSTSPQVAFANGSEARMAVSRNKAMVGSTTAEVVEGSVAFVERCDQILI